jgi:glycosyltransferase involved in cell wall biosynthesis
MLRAAILGDYLEERWPSMDLVAEMLVEHLARPGGDVEATLVRPALVHRLRRRRSGGGFPDAAHVVDRLFNRFWDYPRALRHIRSAFDVYHVVDHSYANLVHALPAARTIVMCHDLDMFNWLTSHGRGLRAVVLRHLAGQILSGLKKAARVVAVSAATRDQLVARGLVPADRITVIPNGCHPSCSPDPDRAADAEAVRLLGPRRAGDLDLLHVGTTVPRKRIDVLLTVFAALRERHSAARLIRVGGPLTAEQRKLARRRRVDDAITTLPFLAAPVLAAVYRRAAVLLMPSEREGFGLPVVEALACGTPVVASDLPALREVGGAAATYCPVADMPRWAETVTALIVERVDRPDRWKVRQSVALMQASQFRWDRSATATERVYREVLDDAGRASLKRSTP